MADVCILPRMLLHRTRWGTRIEWRRGQGLLARDEVGHCQPIAPTELRRRYPEAWPAWVRLAALLPEGELTPWRPRPRGGTAA
jgi:hypothetical protein